MWLISQYESGAKIMAFMSMNNIGIMDRGHVQQLFPKSKRNLEGSAVANYSSYEYIGKRFGSLTFFNARDFIREWTHDEGYSGYIIFHRELTEEEHLAIVPLSVIIGISRKLIDTKDIT